MLNGSPLFTGGAGSGESNIRKWILERDYLEAIIALPTDMFYNTGISTYVWVLSKQKAPERKRQGPADRRLQVVPQDAQGPRLKAQRARPRRHQEPL